ncbi:MAG: phage baseplate assembly protein V [Hyphomicrobium sp.]
MGDFFTSLLDTAADTSRSNVPGLRLAEVAQITEDGYILTWLSGTTRTASAPARAASFMAGKERGGYFPFEIGDEVVVGFVDGCEDMPIILGALWSDIDLPPQGVDTSDTNNTRAIISREKSKLVFDDTQGATSITLESAGGMKLVLDDKGKKLLIQFDTSTTIELSAQGVTVKGTKINLN